MIEATEINRAPAAAKIAAPLLSVNNIEVVYDDVILVLRGLSLDVPKGAIVALLGANGAGKSTTLKAISGLLKTEDGEVTRGEIVFDGERINGIDPDKIVRRGIFQVMEGRRIISDMTSLENLRLGAFTRSDNEVGDDIDMVFKYFPRLKERTGLAGYLSGGEQQMLAIGRALMARPKMILMDEPSMGLSPLLVKEVFAIIKEINRDLGVTILLVEQNARAALSVASHGYIMEQGKVVLDGSADELRDNEDVKEFYLGGAGDQRKSFQESEKLQAAEAVAVSATSRSAEYLLRFGDRAENMIKRRRRDRGNQRGAVAIELIVPAARDGMAEVMPLKARQRRARFVGGARFARLGLRDPRLGDFGLRPQAPGVPLDIAGGVALVDQAAGGLVAIAQRRREQLGAVASGRAAGNSFKSLQQPRPFRLMPGLDADRLDLRPVVLEIFAEHLFLLVVEVGEKQREEIAGAVLEHRIMRRVERRDHRFEQMHLRILPPRHRRRQALEKAAVRRAQLRVQEMTAARRFRNGPAHRGRAHRRSPAPAARRRDHRYRAAGPAQRRRASSVWTKPGRPSGLFALVKR